MTQPGETAADDGFASYCSRYPRLSLAVIVVLIVAVLYLLAERYGWLGLGQKSEPAAKKSAAAKPRKTGKPPAAQSDEIDDLIDVINN